jgi:hypothetical protein
MSADQATQWFLLDRIIHESSAQLKPGRPGIMLPRWARESCVLGGTSPFSIGVT